MILRIAIGAAVGAAAVPLLLALIRRHSHLRMAPGRTWLAATAVMAGAITLAILPIEFALAALPLLVIAVPAAVIDATEHRLPNALTIGFGITAVAALAVLALITGQWDSWIRACLAASAYAALLLAQFLIGASLGPGDVKYAFGLGCYLGWCGWEWWFAGVLLGFLLFAAAAAFNLALRRWTLHHRAPLGPAMLAGTVITLIIAS